MALEPDGQRSFIDYYGLVGGDPDLPAEELKRLYHEKLREYHPDKRPDSAGGTGQRLTQTLNEAWEVLRDPQRKDTYDDRWRREKEKAMPAHERADLHRRRGNELYTKAKALSKDGGTVMNMSAVHQSMKLYKSAMQEYSTAMESSPNDHRLFSNRALCFLAVEEWEKAKKDAQYCARLRPDFKKAWLLVTKALWKMGRMEEACDQLQQGLRYLPGCSDLLELQADFSRELGGASFRQASRSVSPAFTPPASRQQTPTRNYSGTGPNNRPVSPPLLAAGGLAAQNRSQAAATYGGPSSVSPGPSINRSPAKNLPTLDASGTFHTGNFGAPTPVFAASSKMHPSHDAMAKSFPASAHTMWAGNSGNAGQRSSYSPGPSHAGVGGVRTASHSPGPNFGATAGPELGSSARAGSRDLRKSASLKGMLDSSSRSRGATPPSRSNTPPPPPPRR